LHVLQNRHSPRERILHDGGVVRRRGGCLTKLAGNDDGRLQRVGDPIESLMKASCVVTWHIESG